MGGVGGKGDRAEIGQIGQAALQAWVHRMASGSARGLRGIAPSALLSLLCAAALSPLLAAVAGLGAGAAVAGSGVLSTVSGGVLSEILARELERARSKGNPRAATPAALEGEVAEEIGRMLAAGGASAGTLRAEIANLLREIDAGGTVLRAALEQGNERVRGDVIDAIGALGSDFAEMGFLIKDVARAAAEIQKTLDVQAANFRVIIEQNNRQSTDIRLVRDDVAVVARRAGAGALTSPAADGGGPRWVRGRPYRGLLPFGEADVEVFYGRERLTAELAVKVATQAARGGLVVVTGASGAGKSSLLHAGLLPKLAQGQQVAGSDYWPRIAITPTKDPMTELAIRLAALGGSDAAVVRDGLRQRPGEAHLAVWPAVLADASRRGNGQPAGDSALRLVLIVDQFEQVFTLNRGPEGAAERQAFISALCAAATSPVGPKQEPPAVVVIAVRGDFWDRCAAYPELAGALQEGQFLVGPMSESDLRLAITGPADAAGLRIDPALTDTILGDLRAAGGDHAAGVLPLLSQAMSLTWDKREGDRLTSHGYGQAGGVSHAVQTSADSVYNALSAGQQALARELLRAMTVASRDGGLTRRPVSRADLYAGPPATGRSQVDAVLEAFAAERLIVLNAGTAQISHDVLLSAWPRLRGWLEEDQASWILHGQLADDAAAWRDSQDDPSFLYRGTKLAALRQAATRWSANPARYPALTSTQREFLHDSERATARRARQRRNAVAALAVLTLAAVIASVLAFQQRASALRQRNQAVYNQILAEALQASATNSSLAAQLNLAAYRMQPTQDLAARLLGTENTPLSIPLTRSTDTIRSVAFSRDGALMARGGRDGLIRLWDVAAPAYPRLLGQPVSAAEGPVLSVAFSPDGRTLASAGGDGTIRLWDVADPARPQSLGQPLTASTKGASYSVAFSPDGRTLASGSDDGLVRLWDVANPARAQPLYQPLTTGHSIVRSVAFSPDGRTLASGSDDGLVRLWDVADPARAQGLGLPLLGDPYGEVSSVAFSPNGRTLASGAFDGTIRLWDVANPARPGRLGQPLSGTDPVISVAFSPDGKTVASGGANGTIRLWDVAYPVPAQPLGQPLTGTTGAVFSVAFSPKGGTLASGGSDGLVRLWNIPPTVLTGSPSYVLSMAFSPDGRTLAIGSAASVLWLWDIADPAHPQPLGQPLCSSSTCGGWSVAFSPDSRALATGSSGGIVQLWNVADPAQPKPLGQPLTRDNGNPVYVAFSPHSHTLASGSADGTVRLWDTADPAHPRPVGQFLTGSTGSVSSLAFSPDGRTLVISGSKGRLWDVADPAHPRPVGPFLTGGNGGVCSAMFSPDGRTLASGDGNDGLIRLWDAADPAHVRPLGQPLTGSTGGVCSLAFSPDGRALASAGNDGLIQLWHLADPARPQPVSQTLASSTSIIVQSVAFSPNGHILASGGSDSITRLWNLNVSYAIERICTTARNNLVPQQWHNYIPQLPYQPPCGR
jgi:WD40 repeat protein